MKAAPSLPAAYVAVLDGLPIGPKSGSCGTAAFLARRVIVEDIESDPLWEDWREAAARYNVRACWSHPIVDHAGTVLGTCALHYDRPHRPTPHELDLVEMAAHVASIAIMRDRAQQSLRQSEERFRELAETIEDVFYVTDPERRRVLYVSPAYERIFGRSAQSLYQTPNEWWEAVHPEDRERVQKAMATQSQVGTCDEEYRIVRPDGGVRWIRDQTFPVRTADGKVVRLVGVMRDVTEGRRLQEQLQQVQRLEAAGQLAAGIAHDFNNVLTVILGSCELAQTLLDPTSPVRPILHQALEATRREAALTRQLLAFTRQQPAHPQVLDLKAHLNGLMPMLRSTIPENIAFRLSVEGNRWPVLMDPAQVDQIVLNLLFDARDAMPHGGTITIEVTDVTLDEVECATRPGLTPGHYVRLSVTDTGHGMGMGLASVYGIVAQNRGHIELISEVGRGTTVVIHLPRAEGQQQHARESEPAQSARGPQTLLLVEDDEQVRRVTRHFLEVLGYQVLEAATPRSALALSESYPGEIALLLTDIVLPEMDGPTLAECIRARRPTIGIVYMSGYAPGQPPRVEHPIVQKPFDLETLSAALRQASEERRTPRSTSS